MNHNLKFNFMNKNIFRFGLVTLAGMLLGGMIYGVAHACGGSLHVPSMAGLGGAGALLLLGTVDALPAPTTLIPKSSKDLAGITGFFTNLRQQFASAATIYEGPLKQLIDDVIGKLDETLKLLPKAPDTNWSLNDQLENLFCLLNSANSVANALALELSKVKQQMAAVGPEAIAAAVAAGTHIPKTDFDTAVSAAVAKRTAEGGDLVTQESVKQLCSAAKSLGVQEGRAARDAELATAKQADELAATRRTALTTAGLPLPEADVENVLRLAEPEFAAARTIAEKRLKTLAGIALDGDLLRKVWLGEPEFAVFHKTVSAIPALKRTAEPLAGGPPAESAGKKMVM